MNDNSEESILIIIQARMSSKRLPGKVLQKIQGKSMLQHVFERCRHAKLVNNIVVATSTSIDDDAVDAHCRDNRIPCLRGDLNDVLDRFYRAACAFQPDTVIRITADCPLIDPEIIDATLHQHCVSGSDYTSNVHPPTFPDGLDVEVFSFELLSKAWKEAKTPHEREHVTPWMYAEKNYNKVGNYKHEIDRSALRWTVDEARDLEFCKAVYAELSDKRFGINEVLELIEARPELLEINQGIERNEGSTRPDSTRARTGQSLYRTARELIPGGTQLLSKRPEMFLPENWPSYYDRVSGVDVWDMDGNHYLDFTHNGIGTCVLGAADPDVDRAIFEAIRKGTMSTLNCSEEVSLAELLCELHPWAENVRYCRTGGEAMSLAVRITRASTGRDKIAFCGYHGWHDWYLSANLNSSSALNQHLLSGLAPDGVPSQLGGTALPFRYNKIEELVAIIEANPNQIAAIIMEPIRGDAPNPGFLESIRKIASESGAILIFDECSSGFRITCGGAHLKLGVSPDIAMFAKAMSNGYPMAAVIGRKKFMCSAERTFMSSTYWTERIGPTAAIATIKKFREQKVELRLIEIGRRVQEQWRALGKKHGIPIHVGGIEPLSHFSFDIELANEARTFFTQEMLANGYLANGSFYPTYAHTDAQINDYLDSVDQVFAELQSALQSNSLLSKLKGPVAHSGFRRLVT